MATELDALSRAVDLESFRPTLEQERAKARLQLALRDRAEHIDLATLSADEVAGLAGNRRVLTWLRDPGFAAWLADKDGWVADALAMRQTVISVIADILTSDYEPKILTAKDKLKAADMLAQIAGMYPPKSREVRFLDAEVERMSPDQVRAELSKLRGDLTQKLPAPTPG
jgi:hypothetical protein